MGWVTRDGVRLYHEQHGSGDRHMVFVHGWCCDQTFVGPLLDHFANSFTVATVDLRGCGQSDHPDHGYDVASFADDIAHVCRMEGPDGDDVRRAWVDSPTLAGHFHQFEVADQLIPMIERFLAVTAPRM